MNGYAIMGGAADRAILIRLDPLAVAASQAGAKGRLAATVVPQLTTTKVLDQMAAEIKKSLASQSRQSSPTAKAREAALERELRASGDVWDVPGKGIVADVSIIADTGQPVAPSGTDLLTGVVIGAGSVGLIWLLRGLVVPWIRGLWGGK